MKRILFYVLYLPVSVVCLLLLAELGLRLVGGSVPSFVSFEFHPDLAGDFAPGRKLTDTLIRGLPYHVTTNSQGLRATRELDPHEGRAVRVLCLGDSFTFGVGVNDNETYPAQLEAILKAKYPGRSIEVLNAGMPFFDVIDELDYWEQKGRLLRPDLVVCQFFYNDLLTMNGESFRRVRRAESAPYSPLRQVLRQSRIYAAATTAAYGLFKAKMLPAVQAAKPRDPWYEGRYCPEPSAGETAVLDSGVLDQDNMGTLACRWDRYYAGLMELRGSVERSGARFLFLNVPDQTQVTQGRIAPSAYLNPRLARDGVAAVDILPTFWEAHHLDRVELYNTPYDFHANRAGNTIIAALAARAISLPEDGRVEVGAAPWYGFESVSRLGLAVDHGSLTLKGDDGLLAGELLADERIHVQGLEAATDRAEATAYGDPPGVLEIAVSSALPRSFIELRLQPIVFDDKDNGSLEAYVYLDNGYERLAMRRAGQTSGDDAYIFSAYTPERPFSHALLRFVVGKGTGLVLDKTPGVPPARLVLTLGR